ncbi:MAG: DUF533 domain-containing protein [Betaproteobacteria bacterium]|nr:DUF533 domain-containing protein [Betaproteobacteria bacterium]
MTTTDPQSLVTIALLAAFADGNNTEAERAEVKRIADSLSASGEMNIAAIYQDVLMKRVDVASAAAQLSSAESKTLAYELAVCVCDADGAQTAAEKQFLAQLAQTLGVDAGHARAFNADAESLAAAPLAAGTSVEPPLAASTMSAAEQDAMILNYAILNGALELLPDTMASMAIIPLQMRMVYRIGKSYGYELDRGHIKDFLATAGVGLASQYIEQAGVKLIGKVFGRGLIGGLIGGLAKQAVSSGFSFGTTYALGHLAKRYYAGGRTFSTAVLKDTYQNLLGEAKSLEGQYLPAIRDKARTLNVAQILKEVRA